MGIKRKRLLGFGLEQRDLVRENGSKSRMHAKKESKEMQIEATGDW